MSFDWTAEQRARYQNIIAAVRALPAPADGHFTREEWRQCAPLGLPGLSVPAEYGGGGLDAVGAAHAMEAFGRGYPDMGLVFGVAAHLFACAMPITEHGTAEIRERVLPRLCDGTWIAGNAITEDEAGSDVTALTTKAVRTPDGYRLSGEKSFVSNGPLADVFVVYATTDPDLGFLGVSAFVVERDAPGVTVEGPLPKIVLARCPAGRLRLADTPVPESARLGAEGRGAAIFQSSMHWERTCLFAGYLGLMDRVVQRCVAYARERRQFGAPIGSFQAVRHRIADMKLRLEGARSLLYRACAARDAGDAVLLAALAKAAVSEAAVRTATDALQVFGAAAYLGGSPEEKALLDALPSTVFSGTSEMQREIIGKELGL
ncbi:acyl-CoA dehydrogenase family protein [Micromonospora arborensis]|uniref:acyl-CoA dehydrogenase family protein n=1 Tax=Micromonospora arborensis TaxID=2116518 RepID=UPI00342AFE7B